MLINYLKVAFRNLVRHKMSSLINILGLSAGITTTLVLLLTIHFETSFDAFHADADRLFQVSVHWFREGIPQGEGAEFTAPLGPTIAAEIPEVDLTCRVSTPRTMTLSVGQQVQKISEVRHADSAFFSFFSFPLLSGDAKTALTDPYRIVLTVSTADRLFGANQALGATIVGDNNVQYTVSGIVSDPPPNSHLQFAGLVSFSTLYRDPLRFMDWNGGNQYMHYVRLHKGMAPAAVAAKFPDLLWRHINQSLEKIGISYTASLHPITDIHLYHSGGSESVRTNLFVSGITAILVLLIACVNFINLSTAKGARRAKEVGVRKSVGAGRSSLTLQFLIESFIVSAIALCLSVILFESGLPVFRELLGKDLSVSAVPTFLIIAVLLGMFLVVGLLAGLLPALSISSLQTSAALKGTLRTGSTGRRLRAFLVVLQFSISIALIASAVAVMEQMSFARHMRLGFDKENIVVVPLVGASAQDRVAIVKSEFLRLPGVRRVTASSDIPSAGITRNGFFPEGIDKPVLLHQLDADEDFLSTYGVKLLRGHDLPAAAGADESAYLVNESLARLIGWEDPIGRKITRNGSHRIIGVVEDFHFASLKEAIGPLIVTRQPWNNRFDFLSVRIEAGPPTETLDALRTTWQRVVPDAPFDFRFLDDTIDRMYRSEQRLQSFLLVCGLLAISIALVGLLGLSAHEVEERTKEIGIRKTFGASVPGIVGLLSRDFSMPILTANVIAWPLAYFYINHFLEDFVYRIAMPWWVFPLSGGLALLVALATVGTQAFGAARANPVEALRYE